MWLVGFSNTSYPPRASRLNTAGTAENFKSTATVMRTGDPTLIGRTFTTGSGVHDEPPPNVLERHRRPNPSLNVSLNMKDRRNDVVRPNNRPWTSNTCSATNKSPTFRFKIQISNNCVCYTAQLGVFRAPSHCADTSCPFQPSISYIIINHTVPSFRV